MSERITHTFTGALHSFIAAVKVSMLDHVVRLQEVLPLVQQLHKLHDCRQLHNTFQNTQNTHFVFILLL